MKKLFIILVILIIFSNMLVADSSLLTKKEFADTIRVVLTEIKADQDKIEKNPMSSIIATILNFAALIIIILGVAYIFITRKNPFSLGKEKEKEEYNNKMPIEAMKYIEEVRSYADRMDANFRQVDGVIKSNNHETCRALAMVKTAVENNTKMLAKVDETLDGIKGEIKYMQGRQNGRSAG